MRKGLLWIFMFAGTHFGLTYCVVTAGQSAAAASAYEPQVSAWLRFLVLLSKILYFPVISLVLYPRQWFPGNLIYIPIGFNSFLWASMAWLAVVLIRRRFAQQEQAHGSA